LCTCRDSLGCLFRARRNVTNMSSTPTYLSSSCYIYCYMCPHPATYVSSYCYMCALILLHVCPHTATYVPSYCYMCPHTLILPHMVLTGTSGSPRLILRERERERERASESEPRLPMLGSVQVGVRE
jgi:hypothetical protein